MESRNEIMEAMTRMQEDVLAYLCEKYQETFEIEAMVPHSMMSSQIDLISYPQEDPEFLFNVYYDVKNNRIEDNYQGKKLATQIENLLGEQLSQYGNLFHVFVKFSNDFDCPLQMNLKEFLATHPHIAIRMYIHFEYVSFPIDDLITKIERVMSDCQIRQLGTCTLVNMDHEQLVAITSYFHTHTDVDYQYELLIEKDQVRIFSLENGRVL